MNPIPGYWKINHTPSTGFFATCQCGEILLAAGWKEPDYPASVCPKCSSRMKGMQFARSFPDDEWKQFIRFRMKGGVFAMRARDKP